MAAYPKENMGDKPEATFRIWDNILLTFPFDVAEEAAKVYLFEGHKYFPTISEFVKLCDEVWQKHERIKKEENSMAEHDAAKLLFSESLDEVKKKGGNIAAMSVALVRDVCNGEIKYRSPDWNKRQAEIEELASM